MSELVKRYSCTLADELGISHLAARVVFYLFVQKVYQKNPEHSAYALYNGMRSQARSLLPLYNKSEKVSEKNITKAVSELVALGYVETHPTHARRERSGRPAKCLYSLKDSQEIAKLIELRIKQKHQSLLGIFNYLYELEEAAGLIGAQ